ncbi:geranylgeranyl pyrophosphate synthetase [Phlyctema vagabunda]|uniref:Geranylgeranyl pyrophosphate synthetase n=1 Tax=Phlyctema vagabunda TaxID=108571 RepID=A0ABR4P180_9HELO
MFSSSSYQRFDSSARGRGGSRGSGRGRGRGSYRGQGWHSAARETPRSPSPPIGPVLTTIRYSELRAGQAASIDAKITGLEDVASYNWLKADEPTVMTPGKPPKWTPITRPTKLLEDNPNGTYYRDPNAAYFPSYPMEPVVRSIFEARPDFNAQEVNVFGCGSTLGNLLRFARKVETEKPFRFLVEVVGETVFLIRRENSPKEVIADIRGYGHSFPEANTTWDADVKSSDTHQRIIRYQLGHLNTMVRFEADGYLAEKVPTMKNYTSLTNQEVTEDSLVSALAGSTMIPHRPNNSDSLKVTRGQDAVPQSTVFDLKTRSIKKKPHDSTISDQIPRLWIRQIPFLVLAYHEYGLFRTEEVTVRDIKPDTTRWESDNEEDVRKLIGLIEKIADVVKAMPGRKLEVRYRPELGLELREQVEGVASVLPSDLAARWAVQGKRAKSTFVNLENHSADKAISLESGSIEKGVALDDATVDALDDDEYDWDKKEDYTACSMESCNYCGQCSY